MENVKGILSAERDGKPLFPRVLRSLRDAGHADSYRLFALSAPSGVCAWDEGLSLSDFLVSAENHGVPQSRHRVFVICVRRDLAETLPEECLPRLEGADGIASVNDVIGAMPRLRSRLSRGDSPDAWQDAVRAACDLVDEYQPDGGQRRGEAVPEGACGSTQHGARNRPALSRCKRTGCSAQTLPAEASGLDFRWEDREAAEQ